MNYTQLSTDVLQRLPRKCARLSASFIILVFFVNGNMKPRQRKEMEKKKSFIVSMPSFEETSLGLDASGRRSQRLWITLRFSLNTARRCAEGQVCVWDSGCSLVTFCQTAKREWGRRRVSDLMLER